MSMFGDYFKVKKVIESCVNMQQFPAAEKMVELFNARYTEETSTVCLLQRSLTKIRKRQLKNLCVQAHENMIESNEWRPL